MALFSERYGYTKPAEVLIRETITEEIENALCSSFDVLEETLRPARGQVPDIWLPYI